MLYIQNFSLIVETHLADELAEFIATKLRPYCQQQHPHTTVFASKLLTETANETATFTFQFHDAAFVSNSWLEIRKQLVIEYISTNFPHQLFCFDTLMQEI